MNINYMAVPGTVYVAKSAIIMNDHEELFKTVCAVFGQNPENVLNSGRCRKRDFVIVKQVAMTLFRLRTNLSLTAIGNYFSRDHATCLHSIKTVKNLRETDRAFREQTDCLFSGLNWPYFKN